MAYPFYENKSKAIYFLEISFKFLGLRKRFEFRKKNNVTAFKNYAKLNLGNTCYFSLNSEVLN